MRKIDRDALHSIWHRASALYAQHMAQVGIQTVAQPSETLTKDGFTDERYGRDPATAVHRTTPDYAHMNMDYGMALWRALYNTLGV